MAILRDLVYGAAPMGVNFHLLCEKAGIKPDKASRISGNLAGRSQPESVRFSLSLENSDLFIIRGRSLLWHIPNSEVSNCLEACPNRGWQIAISNVAYDNRIRKRPVGLITETIPDRRVLPSRIKKV